MIHTRRMKEGSGWVVHVSIDSLLTFDSTSMEVFLPTEESALDLGRMVKRVAESSIYRGPHDNPEPDPEQPHETWREVSEFDAFGHLEWQGRSVRLHVEHMSGPLKGGYWWWGAFSDSGDIGEHENEIKPRSASSARWLASLGGRFLLLEGS